MSSPAELGTVHPTLFSGEIPFEKEDTDSIRKDMIVPTYDLLDRGGKRWRPCLGLVLADCFGRNTDDIISNLDVYYLCGITEIIHNASLMIDDIEDGSL